MKILSSCAKPQFVFRPHQVFRRLWREFHEPSNPVVETRLPWGLKIRINSSEIIGRNIWHQGLYDTIVCEALHRLVSSGDTVVDAGANIGQMTGLMAMRAGPSGRVLAFEPQPVVFQNLSYNISLFGQCKSIARIEAHEVALSDCAGTEFLYCGFHFPFNSGTAHFGDGGPEVGDKGIPVQKKTLDSFIGDRTVSVLKIDVEGHELSVFHGAKEALGQGRIHNIVYEDFGTNKEDLGGFLDKHGFRRFALGWKLSGPLLSEPSRDPQINLEYEAPNYIATLFPDALLKRFSKRGWRVLGV